MGKEAVSLSKYTLIEFIKFEVKTVSMAKTYNLDSNISDFNSVDLRKAQKIIKCHFFQLPNLKAKHFKFYDFFFTDFG